MRDPRWLRVLASPHAAAFLIAWLFVLVALGTLAQVHLGLHQAQARYFDAWFLFAFGFVPLPAGKLTLGLLCAHLAGHLGLRSGWAKPGIAITHVGIVLLLLGGLISGAFRSEGALALYEGESGKHRESYLHHELAIRAYAIDDDVHGGPAPVDRTTTFGEGLLQPGSTLKADGLALSLQVVAHHAHARLADGTLEGLPRLGQAERHTPGVELLLQSGERLLLVERQPITERRIGGVRYAFLLRRAVSELPFEVTLRRFIRDVHPGTEMARGFSSEVDFTADGVTRRAVISMNQPLRHRGWTLYQASFSQEQATPLSVFAVVHDRFQNLPALTAVLSGTFLAYLASNPLIYIPSMIIAIGLLWHLLWRFRQVGKRARVATATCVAALLLAGSPGHAANQPELSERDLEAIAVHIAPLPVLHEGRIKPLESLARHYLLALGGRSSAPALRTEGSYGTGSGSASRASLSATAWLVEILVEANRERAYARPVIKVRNPDLVAALELPERSDQRYGLQEMYAALGRKLPLLRAAQSRDEGDRTPIERELGEHARNVIATLDGTDALRGLKLIPGDADQREHWLAMQVFQDENLRLDPTQREVMLAWVELYQAASSASHAGVAAAAARITTAVEPFARQVQRQRELTLHAWKPFTWAWVVGLLSLITTMVGLVTQRRAVTAVGTGLLAFAVLTQIGGIALRVMILERAPVGTLYESILFVAAVGGLLGLMVELCFRNGISAAASALLMVSLCLTAGAYASDGDSLGMLVAVLNSQFWLLIHVLTITAGYAACLIAAALALIALLMRIVSPEGQDEHRTLDLVLLALTILALILTLCGTILGGIWADQSWGRFWGWDPKENGALLIVLALLVLLHLRVAGQVAAIGFAAGLVLISIVVLIAWFGVNLLGIGLHSYGFDSRAALGLAAATSVLLALGLGLGFAATRAERRLSSSTRPSSP